MQTIKTHEIFFAWLNQYQEAINEMITPSLTIHQEYSPDPLQKLILTSADLNLVLFLQGRLILISLPAYVSFSLSEDQIRLDVGTRDNFDLAESYTDLIKDLDGISGESLNQIAEKIDHEFYEYFDIRKVPMWESRLLHSISSEDLLAQLKEM